MNSVSIYFLLQISMSVSNREQWPTVTSQEVFVKIPKDLILANALPGQKMRIQNDLEDSADVSCLFLRR